MRYRTFMQGAALLVLGAFLYVGAMAFNDYRRLGMLKGDLNVWGLPATCYWEGLKTDCAKARQLEADELQINEAEAWIADQRLQAQARH